MIYDTYYDTIGFKSIWHVPYRISSIVKHPTIYRTRDDPYITIFKILCILFLPFSIQNWIIFYCLCLFKFVVICSLWFLFSQVVLFPQIDKEEGGEWTEKRNTSGTTRSSVSGNSTLFSPLSLFLTVLWFSLGSHSLHTLLYLYLVNSIVRKFYFSLNTSLIYFRND